MFEWTNAVTSAEQIKISKSLLDPQAQKQNKISSQNFARKFFYVRAHVYMCACMH